MKLLFAIALAALAVPQLGVAEERFAPLRPDQLSPEHRRAMPNSATRPIAPISAARCSLPGCRRCPTSCAGNPRCRRG